MHIYIFIDQLCIYIFAFTSKTDIGAFLQKHPDNTFQRDKLQSKLYQGLKDLKIWYRSNYKCCDFTFSLPFYP